MTQSIPVEFIEQVRSVVSSAIKGSARRVECAPVSVSALLPLWVALPAISLFPIPIAIVLTAMSLPVYFVIAKRGRSRWHSTSSLTGYVMFFFPITVLFYTLCFVLLKGGLTNALIQSFIYIVLLVVLVTKPGWSKKKHPITNDKFFSLIFYVPTALFVCGSIYYGIHQL